MHFSTLFRLGHDVPAPWQTVPLPADKTACTPKVLRKESHYYFCGDWFGLDHRVLATFPDLFMSAVSLVTTVENSVCQEEIL
jgi:hypothetical protein